ncbi:hypothetical protein GOODEAATRI_018401, partial [Goodea atripinnis]
NEEIRPIQRESFKRARVTLAGQGVTTSSSVPQLCAHCGVGGIEWYPNKERGEIVGYYIAISYYPVTTYLWRFLSKLPDHRGKVQHRQVTVNLTISNGKTVMRMNGFTPAGVAAGIYMLGCPEPPQHAVRATEAASNFKIGQEENGDHPNDSPMMNSVIQLATIWDFQPGPHMALTLCDVMEPFNQGPCGLIRSRCLLITLCSRMGDHRTLLN